MQVLRADELEMVCGGMNLNGVPPTDHAKDLTLIGYMNEYGTVLGAAMWWREQGAPLARAGKLV